MPSLSSSSSSSQLSLPPSSSCGVCHSMCLQSCLLHPSLSVKLSLIHSIIPPFSLPVISLSVYIFLSLCSSHLTLISNFAFFFKKKIKYSISLAGSFLFSPHTTIIFSSPGNVFMSRALRYFSLFALRLQLQARDWEMNITHTVH